MTNTRYHDAHLTAGPANPLRRPTTRFSSMVTALVRKMGDFIVAWTNRRAIYKLSLLDDRCLQDIGLTRADVTWALGLPLDVDPSTELNALVERKRAAKVWGRKFTGKAASQV